MAQAHKRITTAQLTGQKGINLIEKRVLDMGFLWHPTGNIEAGIDGAIEIRDDATGDVLNNIVQVQSKATEGTCPLYFMNSVREQRRRLEARGCQTVPADGLVSASELVGILERFFRPTAYRLTGVHHTHRDANAVDRYVVHTLDGTRSVPLATAGMAQQFLGQ
jgi:hypothetical protein